MYTCPKNPHKGDESMKPREQTTIRLPAELKERIQQEADCRGYPTKDLIMFILWDYVRSSIAQE